MIVLSRATRNMLMRTEKSRRIVLMPDLAVWVSAALTTLCLLSAISVTLGSDEASTVDRGPQKFCSLGITARIENVGIDELRQRREWQS